MLWGAGSAEVSRAMELLTDKETPHRNRKRPLQRRARVDIRKKRTAEQGKHSQIAGCTCALDRLAYMDFPLVTATRGPELHWRIYVLDATLRLAPFYLESAPSRFYVCGSCGRQQFLEVPEIIIFEHVLYSATFK